MMKAVAGAALAAILLASVATAGGIYGRFVQTNKNRQGQARIWHAVVCDIEAQVLKDKDSTVVQKVSFIRFYDHLLVVDAHAAPCGLLKGVGK